MEFRDRLVTTTLRTRIFSAVGWSVVATVLSRGLLLLSMIVVARILGTTAFGELGVIQSSIAMFETFAALGMSVTAARFVAAKRSSDRDQVGRVIGFTCTSSLVMGSVIAFMLSVLAPWIATSLLAAPHVVEELRIAALILMLTSLTSAQAGALSGFEAFRSMAFLNAIVGLITVPLVVGGAYYSGVLGALWGFVGVAVVNAVLNSIVLARCMRMENIRIDLRITKTEWQMFVQFGLPAMGAGVLFAPINWIGVALLVNQADGYAQMGLITAANQWFSVLLFLPGTLTVALLPLFSEHATNGESHTFKRLVKAGVLMSLLAVAPLAIVIALASPWIMAFYGPEYAEGWPVLAIIVVAATAAASQNMLGNTLAALNRMWVHFGCNFVWAVFFLATVAVLLPMGYGALALATAGAVAYCVKLAVTLVVVAHYARES